MFSLNKAFAVIVCVCAFGHGMAQSGVSRTDQLKKVKTVEQAQRYLEKTGQKSGYIGRFNSVVDSVEFKEISRKFELGEVFYAKTSIYKLLEKESEQVYRCQYIYFDGNVHSKEEIDSLRNQIIRRYRAQENFTELVSQYTMKNPDKSGDSGWFYADKMAPEFSFAVSDHLKGQIFTCDVEEKKAYYVILKTHLDKQSESWIYIYLK